MSVREEYVYLLMFYVYLDVLLVPCLFLAGEVASLVCTADPHSYTQEHRDHY